MWSPRLCLVPGKYEGKCEGNKIQRKSRRKEKVKKNKKNRLKVDKLFFLLLQKIGRASCRERV